MSHNIEKVTLLYYEITKQLKKSQTIDRREIKKRNYPPNPLKGGFKIVTCCTQIKGKSAKQLKKFMPFLFKVNCQIVIESIRYSNVSFDSETLRLKTGKVKDKTGELIVLTGRTRFLLHKNLFLLKFLIKSFVMYLVT